MRNKKGGPRRRYIVHVSWTTHHTISLRPQSFHFRRLEQGEGGGGVTEPRPPRSISKRGKHESIRSAREPRRTFLFHFYFYFLKKKKQEGPRGGKNEDADAAEGGRPDIFVGKFMDRIEILPKKLWVSNFYSFGWWLAADKSHRWDLGGGPSPPGGTWHLVNAYFIGKISFSSGWAGRPMRGTIVSHDAHKDAMENSCVPSLSLSWRPSALCRTNLLLAVSGTRTPKLFISWNSAASGGSSFPPAAATTT